MSDSFDDFFSLPGMGKEWDAPTVRLIVSMMRKDLEVLKRDVEEHETCRDKDIEEIRRDLRENYAPKARLDLLEEKVRKPIAMAYGLATLILALVVTALASLVVRGHPGG